MKKLLFVLIILGLVLLPAGTASAESPYTTWAIGPNGWWYMTQAAYEPVAEIDLDIDSAEDFFFMPDGTIYIADTGNDRIVKLVDFEIVASYGEEILQSPTGIFVDEEGVMYIADAGRDMITILSADGSLINEFGRPDEPLFGRNRNFLPRKVAVDARKNIYVISEGSVDGVVQVNVAGDFIGYFGANSATMTLAMILQRTFLTEEQLSQFIRNEAASPTNIAIDHQGMIYTVTAGTEPWLSIRKFTISGRNIIEGVDGSSTFQDIHISDQGLVVAVDADGWIQEYDLNGTMLFAFGAIDAGNQRLGTLRNPAAIERYENKLYVLDTEKNALVVFQTTTFAEQVHAGVRLYMDGLYEEAMPYFEDVLNFNGSFVMSYQGIADAYFKQRDFDNALAAYRLAEDRDGYSEAFWELRNTVLQQYLTQFLMWAAVAWVGMTVVNRFDNRYGWFDPLRNWLKSLTRFKLVDDFVFMFRFIRQPADSFYYIKRGLRGSLWFALLIYAWVIAVRLLSLYITGFVFNPFSSPVYIEVETEITYMVGLFALWTVANYLISTISDGEGRFRHVVIGTAYSLFPYALFILPLSLVSNVLTMNEVFIYEFSNNLIYVWVAIMLFIMVGELHNYSLSETVRNILLTLFTMGLFLLTGYILYVLFNQLFEFITAIIQEVRLRG